MFVLIALTALAASAEDKMKIETNFLLGGTLGDGSFGFEEPWTEAFFGTEYSVFRDGDLRREFSIRLGFSPTDKTYGPAESHRLSLDMLEAVGEGNFLVHIGLRGSRLETERYTKNILRGELGLIRQLAMSRLGGKVIAPIVDDDDLWGIGVTLDTPLARATQKWYEYTIIVRTEILYTRFVYVDEKHDDPTFRVGLTLRL